MTKTWLDYKREDLRLIPAMIAKGWEPQFDNSDKEIGRTVPTNPPHYPVSFKKGGKHVVKNRKQFQYQPDKGGYWHGTEKLVNGETKYTLYLTLNDVLYGKSVI